mmetsp:Transcript_11734/g.11653  ORF Transcript_11734/g.11653 Transcript_11734/m.11653 type:complete len:117 (+) Transcript_11734:762-1112(+)
MLGGLNRKRCFAEYQSTNLEQCETLEEIEKRKHCGTHVETIPMKTYERTPPAIIVMSPDFQKRAESYDHSAKDLEVLHTLEEIEQSIFEEVCKSGDEEMVSEPCNSTRVGLHSGWD